MTRLDEAINLLRDAVEIEGPQPKIHRKVQAKHRRQWPRLWQAIDAIIEEAKKTE